MVLCILLGCWGWCRICCTCFSFLMVFWFESGEYLLADVWTPWHFLAWSWNIYFPLLYCDWNNIRRWNRLQLNALWFFNHEILTWENSSVRRKGQSQLQAMLLKHRPHQWTWASVLFHFFIVVVSLYSTLVWRFLCNLINMHSSGFSRCSISMSLTVAFLKAYVQGARGLNCYPLFRPLYAFSLDACLYREKLKWNEAHPYKCVAVCMMMLLTYWLATSCVLANIMTECKILVCLFYTNLYPQSWADEFSGSHGGLSMLFMMKVMVQHCVSSCHKVMTAPDAMLPSKCCGDFSTIL
jgi:hypothetical protein